MSRYSLTRLAHEDLDAIWDYLAIECDNPSAAEEQLRRIHETLTLLAAQPRLGQASGVRPDLRHFPVNPYVVFYCPANDGIQVIGVVHGARDMDAVLRNR